MGRWLEFGAAAGVEAGPQAGQGTHQHLAHRHLLLTRHQQVTRLMNRNPPQAGAATGQGFGQHMAAAATEAGRIQGEAAQTQARYQGHNPGR